MYFGLLEVTDTGTEFRARVLEHNHTQKLPANLLEDLNFKARSAGIKFIEFTHMLQHTDVAPGDCEACHVAIQEQFERAKRENQPGDPSTPPEASPR